ncbi:MAG: T9SS type A sorting domain-containing protein [Saprospiraceae bacterium]
MKIKIIVMFFMVSAGFQVSAQGWFESDHRWGVKIDGGWHPDLHFEVSYEKDTVVKNLPCKKWVRQNFPYYQIGPRYTYTDGPKAYVYNMNLDSFMKIYDFSLPVGSIIQLPTIQIPFGMYTYKIDSIDMVQAGDLFLKRQFVKYIKSTGEESVYHYIILENIGWIGHSIYNTKPSCSYIFLDEYYCQSSVDLYNINFNCFTSQAGNYHPYAESCPIVSTNDPLTQSIDIYPNPATDYFELITDINKDRVESLALFDATGKLTRSWSDINSTFPLEGIPAGLYFLVISYKNGFQQTEKLVVSN